MKTLSMPLDEYEKDKQIEWNRGFNNAVYHISKCLKLKPSEQFEYLLNNIGEEEAHSMAKKLGIEIPMPEIEFSEGEGVPF